MLVELVVVVVVPAGAKLSAPFEGEGATALLLVGATALLLVGEGADKQA